MFESKESKVKVILQNIDVKQYCKQSNLTIILFFSTIATINNTIEPKKDRFAFNVPKIPGNKNAIKTIILAGAVKKDDFCFPKLTLLFKK